MSNIFIVGPAWVGDMVMAQTLFLTLKQQQPQCQIDVMAPAWSKPLLARMPQVRQTHEMPLGHGALSLRKRYQLGKSLRAQHYDSAYVLPNSWKSALVPFFAGIPKRVGWRGEMRYGLLNDCRVLDKQRYPLMIQRFIALGLEPGAVLAEQAAQLPKPALQFKPSELEQTLQEFELSRTQPILVLAPGAEFGPAKQWPAEHYAQVALHYHQRGWQVWILGASKDAAVAHDIQLACGHIGKDLTGKTSLGQAIDLIAQANLVVSNDSGLMHIACATGRPTVVIYGSSSPGFTPPLGEHVSINSLGLACSPCFARTCPLGHTHCLQHLLPEGVINSSEQLLKNSNYSAKC